MKRDCGVWINILSHTLKQRMNAALADLGVTGVQSRVIHYILEHYKNGPVFQKNVEEAFGLSRSTTTGILQLLEKNGVIQRESVARDARLKSLVPTEKAAHMDARMHACICEIEVMLTKDISPGQLQLFLEIAAKMYQNLADKVNG
ncbi:MAG TPA: winged helix-turn-helix transcriptional regulator [Candidatus Scatavimonas merdigallinarum]|uniref:Winged helix-turn-helix transcriptional regulator n=1 Tax=Candidatus Scatavimonas merdigallinarum TaxID=2840914 RepID=A0A9D0ZKA3_9FIRM|nr:winged helix-turn-helix transcriptional regulator [Candidatus Scatavimonas merdigallinarum]